ncbi:16S rRNA (cytosine(967)-C(5))-methyltransferase [Salipaludibacillus keqinensis]|uniref:16S rRNA (cytosine(967)-C(5))-methyltransferase n=1 Tax=Salipaludibacillus keqinensis TaxID=2045207 RepID=A0A323TDR9_9BACI|nr:16S rRNA (cytosine(967)-C(5))-methyltransferase RsmB [Salipaludibacillus keqinensis]PYZ93199.1 16S rRNA (cytosine(967)-C(5))-methyltransferase [Salipaludibacillus keqinensis]
MSKKDLQGNVREAALDILLKIEKNQAYSNLLLNDTIKKMKVPARDIPLLTEIVYGTIQHQKKLDFYLTTFSKKPLSKLEDWVRILLRLSTYQLFLLDRIPHHAAINEAVEIAKKRGHKGISGMVNGILRSMLRNDLPDTSEIENDLERLSVETSHPKWLLNRWKDQYGMDQTEQIAFANIQEPVHSVRVNTTLVTKAEVKESLVQEGLEVEDSPFVEESLRVKKGSIITTSAFQQGWISIQDEGSMLVTHVLDPRAEESVLDACAAPGGKSTHIAERMDNDGKLISVDIHGHKVKLILEQQERLKLSLIQGEVSDARKLSEQYEPQSFDRILVDAPCSGLGVIQRKPDLKWSKKETDIQRLSEIQIAILQSVWPLLRKGGRLVYSTCTIDQEENDRVITSFVDNHQDAAFDEGLKDLLPAVIADKSVKTPGMVQLFPGEYGTDGFFISAIKKQVDDKA